MDTQSTGELYNILNNQGIEQLLYYIMENLPLSTITSFFLVFTAFISYVTAADSSTDAIGDLCTKNFTSDTDEKQALPIKILWGTLIGLVSWIMISTVGIAGVKKLSYLGGLPATLILWIRKPSLVEPKA